jgi:hypothetical protein
LTDSSHLRSTIVSIAVEAEQLLDLVRAGTNMPAQRQLAESIAARAGAVFVEIAGDLTFSREP